MEGGVQKIIRQLPILLPRRLRLDLEESMIYAQVQTNDFSRAIGILVALFIIGGILIGLAVFLAIGSILLAIPAAIAGFFICDIVARSIFLFLADAVATQVEKVLPDMLMLMAANLRAGMIPENSFLSSIKPEFGKLNLLLSRAAVEVQGGKDFRDALVEMSNRTTSHFFRDTMKIIGEGLRSGAELHLILENLSVNILQNESIRNDMRSQVRSYSLFIFIASTVAAPLLYGVSSFLIGILDNIGSLSSSTTAVPAAATGMGLFSSFTLPQIPTNLILIISIFNVIITTTSSALLNGILNSGNARDGLRYIPIFVLIGLGIFFIVRIGVGGFFSSSSIGSGSPI
jgi:flagellar protein FlaJ